MRLDLKNVYKTQGLRLESIAIKNCLLAQGMLKFYNYVCLFVYVRMKF